jgi:hypothetical protein
MSVKVSYDQIGGLYTNLLATQTEFDAAAQRRSDLAQDIAQPYGQNDLRAAATDFESQWDDRRKKLNEGLQSVIDRAKTVLEGFGDFDLEAAASMADQMQTVE